MSLKASKPKPKVYYTKLYVPDLIELLKLYFETVYMMIWLKSAVQVSKAIKYKNSYKNQMNG